jgi:hypothetical protein
MQISLKFFKLAKKLSIFYFFLLLFVFNYIFFPIFAQRSEYRVYTN